MVTTVEAAPLGAFVPWQPLGVVTVPALEPGASTVVHMVARRRSVSVLGSPNRVRSAQLLQALAGSRPPPGPRTRAVTVLADLPPDPFELLGQAKRRPDVSILGRRFPLTRQRAFVKKVAGDVGFDFQAGRLDSTTHPFFTTVGPGDCRITTRYALNRFGDAFFAGLHEVGHGLYEQGLPAAAFGTPLGECPSVGLHESQARLWENTVGRSLGF